ncbi:MAG: glycosyl transferase family 2, partial [Flavobacterium sp.]|nr:glycosyl transferase family 2 [Flavobacterium sp.]
ISAAYKNKSLTIGVLSVVAVWKQFFGYGTGFMKSYLKVIILKQRPQEAFPELFFKL